jgi:Glyoxalase-like domain
VLLGIDHVVIAVHDLDAAAAELGQSVGLVAAGGGRHPSLGTRNRLAWLGDTYVELAAIEDPAIAATSWLGVPVAAALAGGCGLATWAIATDSISEDVDALRVRGAGMGEPAHGGRIRDDGAVVRWRFALPGVIGPLAPFLIEHDAGSAEWTPADRAARAAEGHPVNGPGRGEGPVRLEVLELPVDDIPAGIQRLARAPGLRFRPSLAGGGARDANLGRQVVRLAPAHGRTAPPTIRLASPAAEVRTVDALGCHWTIRRSA